MITAIALIKGCFWRCFFWQDFPKVHSRGFCVYRRGWSMNGDLFTLSGSLPYSHQVFMFFALSLQTKISLRFFSPQKSTNLQKYKYCKKKENQCLASFFLLYWTIKTKHFYFTGNFLSSLWNANKITPNLHRFRYNKTIGWVILFDLWATVCLCVRACKYANTFIQKWQI